MQTVAIELNTEEAEAFKQWRQFQKDWDKLFSKTFTGSLTIHRDNKEIVFEWRTRRKCVIHS